MNRRTIFSIALGTYFSCALGLTLYHIGSGQGLVYSLYQALYWSYLVSCLVFLLISIVRRYALFTKLTTYFQIWGTLGTFVGLIQMCDSIKLAVNAGDTEAIRGVLGGFSTALMTSLIGMLFALINDMLPEEAEAPEQSKAPIASDVSDESSDVVVRDKGQTLAGDQA